MKQERVVLARCVCSRGIVQIVLTAFLTAFAPVSGFTQQTSAADPATAPQSFPLGDIAALSVPTEKRIQPNTSAARQSDSPARPDMATSSLMSTDPQSRMGSLRWIWRAINRNTEGMQQGISTGRSDSKQRCRIAVCCASIEIAVAAKHKAIGSVAASRAEIVENAKRSALAQLEYQSSLFRPIARRAVQKAVVAFNEARRVPFANWPF
jgi:hypothetical protein